MLIKQAFISADKDGFTGTDEASLLERSGVNVALVTGSSMNLKITGPDDLVLAEGLLSGRNGLNTPKGDLRIGHGYDAHRLVEGRELILGGVTIDNEKGLLGHSDADVLIHHCSVRRHLEISGAISPTQIPNTRVLQVSIFSPMSCRYWVRMTFR